VWALSFLPASFHREHQTGDASAGLGKERLSQSSLPSISSPSQTKTMWQLSLSPATLSQQSQPLSPPSVPPSANVAAGVCARAIDAQVTWASARVPGIGARVCARTLRPQGLHESSLSTQALPAVHFSCDGPAVFPEFLLGITAGMRVSRKGSGAKAAKSTRVVR
jgi:hypothetical protein